MSATAGNQVEDTPSMSVKDVLDSRHGPNGWHLAVVQRDEVWDDVRTRQLLDSLLRGYPIGALLLGRVHEDAMTKTGQTVSDQDWLILDGQQRMKAFDDLFHSGKYYLLMTSPLAEPQPRTARTNKARGLEHIYFDKDRSGPPEPTGDWLSLAAFAKWAATAPRHSQESAGPDWLEAHQGEFDLSIEPKDVPTAVVLLEALSEAWHSKRIPVLRVAIRTAMDVLEVFTRVNMAGVNVTSSDVYFAGVKTFWPAAEQSLARFAAPVSPPFLDDRQSTLRFVSRLAAVGIGQADTLPLAVDRLAGPRGEDLRLAMQELTGESSSIGNRLAAFTHWYRTSSELTYALRLVHPDLFDIVLAWAAARPADAETHSDQQRQLIDTFLVGASLFAYPSILGDSFRRKAFIAALNAGSHAQDFPLHAILRAVRPLTSRRGRTVQPIQTDESKIGLALENGSLLIALIQRIQLDLEPQEQFDWDHIIPRSHSTRMQVPGRSGRKVHHKHRHLINSPGNLWALDYSLNRSLKAAVGQTKFDRLDDWGLTPTEKFRVLDIQQVSVTAAEKATFIEVDHLLNGNGENVDRAMEMFSSLVRSRMKRLLDDAIGRFPDIVLFGFDADIEAIDESTGRQSFAAALGLTDPYADLRGVAAKDARRRMKNRLSTLLPQMEVALAADLRPRKMWSGVNSAHVGWAAAQIDGGSCCEIICRWTPESGALVQFKAYPKYGKSNHLYPDFDHISLGVVWDSLDADLVQAFIEKVAAVESRHPTAG